MFKKPLWQTVWTQQIRLLGHTVCLYTLLNNVSKNLQQTDISDDFFAGVLRVNKYRKTNPIALIQEKLICHDLNSLHASGDFCRLLITFTNSLVPHWDRQHVGTHLYPNCLTP